MLRSHNHNKPTGQGGGAAPLQRNGQRPGNASELEETPKQRQQLKAVSEAVVAAEREGGYPAALRTFESRAGEVPNALTWKVHLELAEIAKRNAAVDEVKLHLSQALQAQPRTVQVWLEACRTLEELGEAAECRRLLEQGLECCAFSEQLLLKLVRILERLGDYAAFRSLVGSLQKEPLERVYKILAEAAHVEVRAGNSDCARALFRCLMSRLPHQGPIFCEACRVEALFGDWDAAVGIAEIGVQTCAKYGPLWFSLVRVAEKARGARAVREFAVMALRNVCHELHWKFHFEVAAAYSREGNLLATRQNIGLAALHCPKHLRWKVWLLASRSELWEGSVDSCRKLLAHAALDAPARMQAAVCIERARTEEFLHDATEARTALAEAQAREGSDWKVVLESIFMEARQGCLQAAKQAAMAALEMHPATGRLWSALVGLEHCGEDGVNAAMVTCRKAAQEVPKSGEVWCECARVYMNPLGPHFHPDRALKCLEFAVHLTPQYGDSFLELLRLRFVLEIRLRMKADAAAAGFLSASSEDVRTTKSKSDVSPADERLVVATLVTQRVCESLARELHAGTFSFGETGAATPVACDLDGITAPPVYLPHLEVLCTYADPNYGFLWFWCRDSALCSPREVLQKMHEEFINDLLSGGTLRAYAWAVACNVFGLPVGGEASSFAASTAGAQQWCWRTVVLANSGVGTLDATSTSSLSARHFAMGSTGLSRCFAYGTCDLEQPARRRLIFGSDILCV